MVTLGTGTDSVSFASGSNAVNAVIGAGATLQAGDSLAGGSGIDTLNLSGSGSIDLNSIGLTGFENSEPRRQRDGHAQQCEPRRSRRGQ